MEGNSLSSSSTAPVTNSPHLLARPPSEYTIVIPTKGRWRPACQINRCERALKGIEEPFILRKTLHLLDQQQIPIDRVYLFVNEQEKELYRTALAKSKWKNVKIVEGVDGIMEQRNFIIKYFPEGTHIISLDDDVEQILMKTIPNSLQLDPLPPGGLEAIIFDAAERMKMYTKAHLWGLNSTASKNVRNMQVDGISTRNGEVNGFMYGFRNRHLDTLLPRFSNATEDAERSVRYFSVDGIVLRYRMYCCETRCYQNGGGLQTNFGQMDVMDPIARSNQNRKAAEMESARKIHEAFPTLAEAPKERSQAKTLSVVFKSRGGPVLPSTTVEALVNHREEKDQPWKKKNTSEASHTTRAPRASPAKKPRIQREIPASSTTSLPSEIISVDQSDEEVELDGGETEDEYNDEGNREEQQLIDALLESTDTNANDEERVYQAWLRSYNGDFENAFDEAVTRSEEAEKQRAAEARKEEDHLLTALLESQEQIKKQIIETVPNLVEMGFPAEKAMSALRETDGNLELAMEKLLRA